MVDWPVASATIADSRWEVASLYAKRSPGRVGTPDEIGAAAAFLMGRDGTFITGTDLLIDGGVIAAIAAGRYQLTMGG
jgi:NAD(P)-dependent dehydrogenase (short-subunit alcohol dehydrogenase family)